MAESEHNLVMTVSTVAQVRGVGTVIAGTVLCERVKYQDKVRVVGDNFDRVLAVGGVEQFDNDQPVGFRGQDVGILLVGDRLREGIPEVREGMRVYLV